MKVKLILKIIIPIVAIFGIFKIQAVRDRISTPDFWTFDVASGIAIGFTAWAVYLQKQELQEQRREIALNRKELKGQKEQTSRLADLTEQTAKATRLQTEIEFCKKIECQMVYMFYGTIPSNSSLDGQTYEMQLGYFMNGYAGFKINENNTKKYQPLYEELKDYLKPDSQLYNYYLAEDSAFTALYSKCKELTKSQ